MILIMADNPLYSYEHVFTSYIRLMLLNGNIGRTAATICVISGEIKAFKTR